MEKLTYDILDKLRGETPGYLEVTDVDVKRLRDDRSEIQLGDEVAFVATASFRLTHDGINQLKSHGDWKTFDLAVGDELLVIGADAELRSDRLPIDEDSVTRWLADRYTFTFLLDGADHAAFRDVGRIQVATSTAKPLALPWIRKLNTAAVKHDYIDVDVKIDEQQPPIKGTGPSGSLWSLVVPQVQPDSQQVFARLDIESPALAVPDLIGKVFHVPVESSHGDVRFTLTFTRHAGDTKIAPRDAEPPAMSTKPTKP